MTEAPRLRIREIDLFERPVQLRLPFRFGAGTVTQCPQAFARVRIELGNGRSTCGAAAEMMVPKWFDKNRALSSSDNFNQLRLVTAMARDAYLSDGAQASAFGHFARHHAAQRESCAARGLNALLAGYGPALIDRALLDALCRALGVSFYAAMRANVAGIGAQRPEFAGLAFDAFLAALHPADSIAARHTVGLLDPISDADTGQRACDGLPETLQEVVRAYGHRHFKLNISGKLEADIQRLSAIAAVLDGIGAPYYTTLDGSEQFADAQDISRLAARMRETRALAQLYGSILYIEQPIARQHALEIDLREHAIGKPVIIDESDDTLDGFVQARARGYAGVSSRACKGVYHAILNAARRSSWNAHQVKVRYITSGEDLITQPGLAVQQDLALANLLGITHVERNGQHYVNGMAALPPHEQQTFLRAHPDLYQHSHGAVRLHIEDGRIALASLDCPGFASAAMPDFNAMQPMAGMPT